MPAAPHEMLEHGEDKKGVCFGCALIAASATAARLRAALRAVLDLCVTYTGEDGRVCVFFNAKVPNEERKQIVLKAKEVLDGIKA